MIKRLQDMNLFRKYLKKDEKIEDDDNLDLPQSWAKRYEQEIQTVIPSGMSYQYVLEDGITRSVSLTSGSLSSDFWRADYMSVFETPLKPSVARLYDHNPSSKIRCKYCGQVNHFDDLQCRGCGAGIL